MRPRRMCLLLLAGGSLLIGALPAAVSAQAADAVTVPTRAEAWYRSAEVCTGPLDCSLLPTRMLYPEESLHVGLVAGQQTDATYIELDLSPLPVDGAVTGGILRVPIDTRVASGSVRPQDATPVACHVVDYPGHADGDYTSPPRALCDLAAVSGVLDDGTEPAFAFDLGELVAQWGTGPPGRIAILPFTGESAASETWHLSLWRRTSPDDEARPISAELFYRVDDRTDQDDRADEHLMPTETPVPGDPVPAEPPPRRDALEMGPVPPSPDPPVVAPPQGAPRPGPVPATSSASLGSSEYAYPLVWILPLLMLTGLLAAGTTLTRPIAVGRAPMPHP